VGSGADGPTRSPATRAGVIVVVIIAVLPPERTSESGGPPAPDGVPDP
jgi:hypothetical protein